MLAGLCGILVVYALGVLFVHWLARRRHLGDDRHYVLVAGNHEKQIEWYMRSLMSFSRRTGMGLHITVVLEDSKDDTAAIVQKFAKDDRGIEWRYDQTWKADQALVWIDLAREEDVARLPL
ncbi:hypothetical protein [Cohnella thailandensis]|jgi:hypothetical protein|uniref:Uncharacterized protein n=1 Tax=Cohnella thailandensis TaxID=557557 RepID=A0A841T3I6_9BACL|nr:hypothetical protein [Cohnella thailandensis]MBB6638182.1 hypothetical protein [Cohnella thailandensis]MBP1971893.1 hypothetical protein [Cohnella thailandensis]